jgi:tetrahydromethanopterin S-methyltransferase subunit B
MTDDLNQQIGRLEAQVDNLHRDMAEVKAELKSISAAVNRWKGAGALLMLVGVAFGFIVDMLFKALGK